jgi:hypothetical protein
MAAAASESVQQLEIQASLAHKQTSERTNKCEPSQYDITRHSSCGPFQKESLYLQQLVAPFLAQATSSQSSGLLRQHYTARVDRRPELKGSVRHDEGMVNGRQQLGLLNKTTWQPNRRPHVAQTGLGSHCIA